MTNGAAWDLTVFAFALMCLFMLYLGIRLFVLYGKQLLAVLKEWWNDRD